MRCLGCDKTTKCRVKRSFTWDTWQVCPNCFNDLVPNYLPKPLSARLKVHNR